MKTINFEISKKLNELGLLDNIETENWYFNGELNGLFKGKFVPESDHGEVIKTLTLEEVIEFLPGYINGKDFKYFLQINKYEDYVIGYYYGDEVFKQFLGDTLLESIEKLIEYLLDNNLLGSAK